MSRRHTPIRGKLTRSFGVVDDEDLVVELREEGQVVFRREPADRKLRRGEQLPELVLNVEETCQNLGSRDSRDAIDLVEAVAARIPIAKFEEVRPERVAYEMKCWLIKEMEKEIESERSND
jgi:hypothetical protein